MSWLRSLAVKTSLTLINFPDENELRVEFSYWKPTLVDRPFGCDSVNQNYETECPNKGI
jgi:hypothetical protein